MFLEIVLESIKMSVICLLNDFLNSFVKEALPLWIVMYLVTLDDLTEVKQVWALSHAELSGRFCYVVYLLGELCQCII